MYKRILVAIDGSESGDLALKEALSLAAVHRATLRLVYVIDMVPPYFSGDTNFIDVVAVEEALAQSGRQILQKAHALATAAGRQTIAANPNTPSRHERSDMPLGYWAARAKSTAREDGRSALRSGVRRSSAWLWL